MTTTVTSVNSAAASTALVSADASRFSLIIENSDTNTLYVKIGGAASTTDYSFSLLGGASAEIDPPESFQAMYGIWSADGSGAAQITSSVYDTSVIQAEDANLGDMKARVASELERTLTDITYGSRTWEDEIEAAIKDSIRFYRSKGWWFLQEPSAYAITTTTTIGEDYTNEASGLIRLDSLRITIDNQKQNMRHVNFFEMEEMHDGSSALGQPFAYTRYGGRVRLYPTPSKSYTLTWSGTFDETALTSDTVTNAWMTHGEMLIRAKAKHSLIRDFIKSYDDLPAVMDAVREAEDYLDREHILRMNPRKLKRRC